MPLASGADVKIGAYEFMLSSEEGSYEHTYENLYGDGGDLEGSEGKKAANKNILFWGYDNFVAGEGLRYWDKDQSARWWTGNNNPRIPGAITSPPTRSTAATLTTGDGDPFGGFFASTASQMWYFRGDTGFYSTDGNTWTENTDVATELPAGYFISGAASDGQYVFIAASDGANRGIWRVDSTTVVSDFVAAHADAAAYQGLAVRDQFVYAWTGGVLCRYNHLATLPITHADAHVVHSPGEDAPPSAGHYRICAGDDAVYYIRGRAGASVVFEFKLDPQTGKMAGRTMWEMPNGFSGQRICYQAGVVLVGGIYLNKLALWGYSTISRQPFFLGYFNEANEATQAVSFVTPSYGAQVLLSARQASNQYVFVYDLEEDSFSQLDEGATATIGLADDALTWKNLRLTDGRLTSTTSKISRWPQDTDTPAGSWDWESSAHDFGYPQDEKILLGFHVIADPSIAAGTVDLDYQLDEDGSWVDSGTDTAAGSKHTYMQISTGSSTVKFRTLRFRMNGSSGARVFSAYARVYINSKQEVWRLKLDLNNEPGTDRHPTDRTYASEKLRDNLHTLVSDGNVVTFLDGKRKRRASGTVGTGYTSHTVLVEFPSDFVDTGREGSAEVILRSVAPSA